MDANGCKWISRRRINTGGAKCRSSLAKRRPPHTHTLTRTQSIKNAYTRKKWGEKEIRNGMARPKFNHLRRNSHVYLWECAARRKVNREEDLILLGWTLAENERKIYSKKFTEACIQKYFNVRTCNWMSKATKTGWKISAERPCPIKKPIYSGQRKTLLQIEYSSKQRSNHCQKMARLVTLLSDRMHMSQSCTEFRLAKKFWPPGRKSWTEENRFVDLRSNRWDDLSQRRSPAALKVGDSSRTKCFDCSDGRHSWTVIRHSCLDVLFKYDPNDPWPVKSRMD